MSGIEPEEMITVEVTECFHKECAIHKHCGGLWPRHDNPRFCDVKRVGCINLRVTIRDNAEKTPEMEGFPPRLSLYYDLKSYVAKFDGPHLPGEWSGTTDEDAIESAMKWLALRSGVTGVQQVGFECPGCGKPGTITSGDPADYHTVCAECDDTDRDDCPTK